MWAASWENQQFAYAKTKAQISFAVTAKLISAFVFATRIVQFLFYLNPKFQASSSFLLLCRPVCVRPVRKPHCWFSQEAAHMVSKVILVPCSVNYKTFNKGQYWSWRGDNAATVGIEPRFSCCAVLYSTTTQSLCLCVGQDQKLQQPVFY